MMKQADSASVALPDSGVSSAASAPTPELSVANKPAPGQTGPKGLAPRTTYSRVNNGTPNPVDAGLSVQKGMAPDAQSFLPPKIAHSEVPMPGTVTPRMTINSMIKAAAAGVMDHAAVTLEAARQLSNHGDAPPLSKTAAAVDSPFTDSIPTAYVEKFASAVQYVVEHMKLADVSEPGSDTKQGPGDGPNALEVSEAKSENNEAATNMGKATPKHVPPMDPSLQKAPNIAADPSTGLEDNTSMSHPAQPADPMGNDRTIKSSAAAVPLAEIRKLAAKGAPPPPPFAGKGKGKDEPPAKGKDKAPPPPPAKGKGKDEKDGKDKPKEKKASTVDDRLVDFLLSQVKLAEDAINPAQISGGTIPVGEPPEGVRASGEAGPSEPADVSSQKRLISSNEAAINFTKGQAKADPKSDVNKVLTEPALSSAHDDVLQRAFDNTERAGVKISSLVRSSATRALLEKMAEEAAEDDKKKKKESGGAMGTFTAPPVGGAAGAGM